MEKGKLHIHDLVQINPDYDEIFGGHLLVVTEPKEWGCQGYIIGRIIGAVEFNGRAYLRVKWEDMEYVGHLVWVETEREEDSKQREDL